MPKKSDFKTVEFFRKVRDEQASTLVNKNHKEIINYFSAFHKSVPHPEQRPNQPSSSMT